MSTNNWTEQQLAAITTGGCDLLVAAGAGSGKTAVLVERIIRKVIDEKQPVDIDRLLVVTFTNAAASEMRERIGEAITRELDKNPASETLQRQLALLPKTSITTIHSFCLEVIRNNFHVINIDPGFRIADETETTLLKQEVVEELFDQKYDVQHEAFLALVETYSKGRSDEKLMETVVELHKFAESSPWPEKWLQQAADDFCVDDSFCFETTKWATYLQLSLGIELNGLAATMETAISIIHQQLELEPYLECFLAEQSAIKQACSGNWKEFRSKLLEIGFGRLKPIKGVDAELKKKVTELRDKAKKRVKALQSMLARLEDESIRKELDFLYPQMNALAQLVIEFRRLYAEKKKEKSMIDFNDIEHYALEILANTREDETLEPTETALFYREKFNEVLVDEYQDSNLVQEVMLSMVARRDSGCKNLFMVGDVKQSIYRFRQAMPELFLSKYHSFSDQSGSKGNQGDEAVRDIREESSFEFADEQKVLLFKNFRSRKTIIDGVNFIFRQIMSANIGELEYNEVEMLNPAADYPDFSDIGTTGGAIELHLIDCRSEETIDGEQQQDLQSATEDDGAEAEADVEEEELGKIELEAQLLIRRIKELINGRNENEFLVFDNKQKAYRRVEYRDIVILLRATKSWSGILMESFHREGIPAFADTGTGYFETIEIKTILALLQIIDNPMQDIPLLAVLRSPIFGFTPKELIDLRLESTKDSFYDAMKKTAERGIGALSIKCTDFLVNLEEWRAKAIHTPIDELLWFLYTETGYLGYVGAMPGGVQRQANLRILFERAKQFESTSYKGLFNFMNFMAKLKRSNGDMGSAKILGENENVVRIMSIHKSKGLEFPVVFLAGAGKGFNMMDLNGSILYHKELGFGPDYVDYRRRFSYSSMAKEAIKTRTKLESLSEEMRVLYVAFTRAREKLIITGAVKNVEKSAAKWAQASALSDGKLSEFEMLSSKSYLDWICPSVMNHENGQELALLGGKAEGAAIEEGAWDLHFWDRSCLASNQSVEQEKDQVDEISSDDNGLDQSVQKNELELVELVKRRLEYEYPFGLTSHIPAKLTVSELKRARLQLQLEPEESEEAESMFDSITMKRPSFLQQKQGFDAAERGTLMHYVMQVIDLSKTSTIEELKLQLEEMVIAEKLTAEEVKVINLRKLHEFFLSPLGQRMRSAKKVLREVPFSIEVPAGSIYVELSDSSCADEPVMLQGVIDCCFQEEGEFILLDYKTDYVEPGGSQLILERYRVQIDCYTQAIEKITGKKVAQKFLYLFHSNETVDCG